jgi:L-threonylcarbamoyladenylate synthase
MFQMEEDIQSCLKALASGQLILYPTDTVWGIGCDATNEAAVARIFALKKREDSKAMIILVADEKTIPDFVATKELKIFDYIKGIHKPTTVIYPNAKNLAKNLIAQDGSVAIRICKDPFCKQIIQQFGKPIVSTSANISGYPTPMIFSDISLDIIEGVDYVVKHRQAEQTLQQPSSVIQWDAEGNLKIIRP